MFSRLLKAIFFALCLISVNCTCVHNLLGGGCKLTATNLYGARCMDVVLVTRNV